MGGNHGFFLQKWEAEDSQSGLCGQHLVHVKYQVKQKTTVHKFGEDSRKSFLLALAYKEERGLEMWS